MDEASAVDPPSADVSSIAVDSGAQAPATTTITAGDRRAGRRGLLTSRKRLALTIDAELTSETGQQKECETRDGESSTPSHSDATTSGAGSAGDEAAAVPWWVLEYRCPPPGHLGAHDVHVAVKERSSEELEDELRSALETEKKSGDDDALSLKQQPTVFGRQLIAKSDSGPHPELQTEGARDLRRRQHSSESIGVCLKV